MFGFESGNAISTTSRGKSSRADYTLLSIRDFDVTVLTWKLSCVADDQGIATLGSVQRQGLRRRRRREQRRHRRDPGRDQRRAQGRRRGVIMGAGTYKVSGTSDKSDGCIRLLDNVTLRGCAG